MTDLVLSNVSFSIKSVLEYPNFFDNEASSNEYMLNSLSLDITSENPEIEFDSNDLRIFVRFESSSLQKDGETIIGEFLWSVEGEFWHPSSQAKEQLGDKLSYEVNPNTPYDEEVKVLSLTVN